MRKKSIVVSFISNSFEWYDYALFIQLGPIIGEKFFLGSNAQDSLIYGFLILAVGYIARPLGGVLLGIIGDKYGRKLALSISMVSMSIPTFIIGFIPTYETIGSLSSFTLIICRLVQGFSVGGTVANSISFSVEFNKERAGLVGSVPMSSICIGLFLGSVIVSSIKYFLTDDQFINWGWRVPFLLGFWIFLVGVYLKIYAQDTPEFNEIYRSNKTEKFLLKTIMTQYLGRIFISIFFNATGSVIFYLNTVYFFSYLRIYRGFRPDVVEYFSLFCYFIMIFLSLVSGYISDKIGSVKFYFINLGSILILILPIIFFIENGNRTHVIFAQILLSLLSAFYIGAEPALQARLYPVQIRTTSLAIAYNIATAIFGGITPYIASQIFVKYNGLSYISFYVILITLLSIIAIQRISKIKLL